MNRWRMPGIWLICFSVWAAGQGGAFGEQGILTSVSAEVEPASLELRGLQRVEVAGKEVTLLDLFQRDGIPHDWQERLAEESVGELPKAGEEKYVHAVQLRKFLHSVLEKHGLNPAEIPIHLPTQVVVVRRSVRLSDEEVHEVFEEFIRSRYGESDDDVVVSGVKCSGTVVLPAGKWSHKVVAYPDGRPQGDVTLLVDFLVDDEKMGSFKISGRVDHYSKAAYARQPLKKNTVLSEADIEWKRVPVAANKEDVVTQVAQVSGKRLLKDVNPAQPIRSGDVGDPSVIKRGDMVTMVFQQEGLTVTAKGKVQEDGAQGSTVRVVNVKSHRSLACKVLDNETVQIIP